MERTPVQSSNVAEIGYEPSSMTLEVLFTNGNLYQYFDLPEAVYLDLMASESKGKYLHANIRNNYRYAKL